MPVQAPTDSGGVARGSGMGGLREPLPASAAWAESVGAWTGMQRSDSLLPLIARGWEPRSGGAAPEAEGESGPLGGRSTREVAFGNRIIWHIKMTDVYTYIRQSNKSKV